MSFTSHARAAIGARLRPGSGPVQTRLLAIALALLTAAPAPAAARRLRIGFVLDGPWDRNAEVLGLVRAEVQELCGGEHDVQFPPDRVLEADWTPAGVTAALERLLADPELDVVVALGVLASDRACRQAAPGKALVAPAVIDPEIQGLPRRDGTSGVHNLTYLTVPAAVQRDVRAFRELVPFERLVILSNRYIGTSLPDLETRVARLARSQGVVPTVIPVGASAGEALARLPQDAEAVYVMALLQLASTSFDSLVAGLAARRLPSFSSLGEKEVERGLLAGVSTDIFPRMARRLAVTLQRIAAGEDPGGLPTGFAAGERLTLNLETARAIGFYPTWAGMSEAVLIGEERERQGRRLTLVGVMQEAMQANRDVVAEEHLVAGGAQSVREARAVLLPQADVSGLGLLIDADRAAASFGAQAERTLSGTISATQLLFSEPALARFSAERSLQRARERQLDQTRLDAARQAGGAYLDVLRAQTLERIRKENLGLTRHHLELARLRQAVGSAGLSDVYRWESEIAINRKDAIEATATRNLAEMELNRILHQPVEAPFVAGDVTLDDAQVAPLLATTRPYLEDKISFAVLRDFLVEEALAWSPEMAALDAGLAAARRSQASATRAYYLPSLAVQAEANRLFDESGVGSGPSPFGVSQPDTDWNVGLQASFALLRGGGKRAARGRARAEVARLEVERQAAAERIEQRTRSALHRAGASYAGIREARTAAEQARRSLELVSDAYSRGAQSLIDLLDAQNARIVADQAAADAVYDFLDDFLEVQRAVGRFDFAMTAEERADLGTRLRAYAQRKGVEPRVR